MALLANSAPGWATQSKSAIWGWKEKAAQPFALCFRELNLFPSRLPLPWPHPPLIAVQGSEDAIFSKELYKLGLDSPEASLQSRNRQNIWVLESNPTHSERATVPKDKTHWNPSFFLLRPWEQEQKPWVSVTLLELLSGCPERAQLIFLLWSLPAPK